MNQQSKFYVYVCPFFFWTANDCYANPRISKKEKQYIFRILLCLHIFEEATPQPDLVGLNSSANNKQKLYTLIKEKTLYKRLRNEWKPYIILIIRATEKDNLCQLSSGQMYLALVSSAFCDCSIDNTDIPNLKGQFYHLSLCFWNINLSFFNPYGIKRQKMWNLVN